MSAKTRAALSLSDVGARSVGGIARIGMKTSLSPGRRPAIDPCLIVANDNYPLVLTRREAASICRVCLSTFDNWVRKGILPGPIKGTRRWSRVALERALSGGLTGARLPNEHSAFDEWKATNAL